MLFLPQGNDIGVSTHASVRRRPQGSTARTGGRSFNSRLREEATSTRDAAKSLVLGEVSTHASVRRRRTFRPGLSAPSWFQLTPP